MPKKRSKLQTKAELFAVRFLLGGIGVLPLKSSMKFGKSVGRFIGMKFPKLQKTARRNLEIALPELSEAEKEKIIHGTFESLGRHLGFIANFKKFKHEDILNLVEVVGKEENFDPAFERGKGVLFFTGHFGSWEVFNLLAPSFGYGMNILVRRIDNPEVEKYIDTMRTKFGSVTLDKKQSARKMYSRSGKRRTFGNFSGFKRSGTRRRFRGLFRNSGFDGDEHRKTCAENRCGGNSRVCRLGRRKTKNMSSISNRRSKSPKMKRSKL